MRFFSFPFWDIIGDRFGGVIIIRSTCPDKKTSPRGFTLIETIFVIGVLAIILTGTFTLITQIITLNKKISYRSAAYQIMDSKLEELRTQSFDDNLNGTSSSSQLPSGNVVTVTEDYDLFGSAQDNIKQVEVTVEWDFKGHQEVKTATYFTIGGIKN